jgi:tetraacyldisaccharide 4'-kinase
VRKFFLIRFAQKKFDIPVIVVGNISVGGTGKTPLLIAIVQYLQEQGYKPGVVSRGYGGKAPHYPYLLDEKTQADQSGDEPLLIFNATKCLVCVGSDRVAAAQTLIEQGCTHILSDDGLQHYRLGRSLEIAVIDGQRLFGNGQCLPVGPLREPTSRLKNVDFVVVNNPDAALIKSEIPAYFSMKIKPLLWKQISLQKSIQLDDLAFSDIPYAIAGIGNPQRFFTTLDGLSLAYIAKSFPDHHQFTIDDFEIVGESPVVMTEKDAVKCQSFAKTQWYSLAVGAQLDKEFWREFQTKLAHA